MNLEEKKDNTLWYDNPSIVTWLIILIISIIILSSQSFSINSNVNALRMFQDILNHNITYMIALVYFISLKTKFGKKYFDYINIVMMIVFFIVFVTSILTVFQSFNLATLLTLAINTILVVYFFHVFMRGTRFWKEFSLEKSPFNELSSDWFFWALVIVEVTLFAVNLITTSTFNGTVLATFDCIYVILLSRYIYLYSVYLDEKKINVKEEKQEVKESAIEEAKGAKEKEVVKDDELEKGIKKETEKPVKKEETREDKESNDDEDKPVKKTKKGDK